MSLSDCRPSLRMRRGDLSFESRLFLHVTWTIPDCFRLITEFRPTLRSPEFPFADGRYCLELIRSRIEGVEWIKIKLLNSDDPDPGRSVSFEVELKSRSEEICVYRVVDNGKVFRLCPSDLEDVYVPGGTLTVLCSVRSREPGSGVVLPENRMTGNLSSESFPCLYVTWRIPAFFQPTRESRHTLESPEFPFSNRRYRLRLLSSEHFVDIQLVNLTHPVPGRYVSYEVGLNSTTGEEIEIESYGTSTKRAFYIRPSALHDMQLVRFPDGHLTIFCCMRSREPSSSKCGGAETSYEDFDKEALTGISELSLDLRQLLQEMPDSDACLVVSGKEFRAHQNILRARSTVFDAMFSHEMAERESGRVVIDDLDPDSFGDFLEYLYTGVAGEGLLDDNAFGLYKAADKYDVPTLMAKCVTHMRRSLSVDSFCDILAVALLHSDEELLSAAVLFFKENVARIIVTAEWKQFAIDNSESANEMFIKAIAPIVPPGQ